MIRARRERTIARARFEFAAALLVGASLGGMAAQELAIAHPDRIDRAVLVSPAGGAFNQPLRRAMGQIMRDGGREPVRLMGVVAPDYLRFGVPSTVRMFRSLTRYPSFERLLELELPTLVVLAVGIACWAVYGIAIGDLPLIGANTVSFAFVAIILGAKLRYG